MKINFEQIRKNIGETFSRFAMTIAYCAALALFCTLMNRDLDFGKDYLNTAMTIYLVTGIFVSFGIDLRRQVYGKKWMWIAAIISHVAIILNAIYVAHVGQTDVKIGWNDEPYMSLTTEHYLDIVAFVALCLVSPFVRPFFRWKEDMRLWHFSRKFIINGALNGIVVSALFIGGLLLVSCAERLFNIQINNLYADVYIWLWLLLFPTIILMRTPHLHELQTERVADKFSFVILRLFAILLCIYLLMLYAYILRIAFTWELPKGMVSMPVSCMMILLIVVRFIAYGINTEGKKFDAKFLKLLPWLALPTLVLMSVGIGRRLMDYGMTAPRFYLILLNLWFYAMCVYMILRKRIMPIVVSIIVIAFFSSFGPTSAWRLFPETEKEEKTEKAEAEKEPVYGTIVLHPHEELPDNLNEYDFKKIFLAGTIDMGSSEDWQAEAAEYFSHQEGNFLIFNPRQENWDATREGEMDYQVNWELEHLEKANIIIMNFLPDSKSPITLLELGLYARSYNKLHVYCPKEFYRYDNVRITCEKYNVPMYDSLNELLHQITENGHDIKQNTTISELKPRLVVLTDIGPADVEPDDNESAVRLLSYADRFEIEAICTTIGWNCDPYPKEWAEYLYRVIDAYGKDVKNLMKRSEQKNFLSLEKENGKQKLGYWPSAEYIRSRAMMGSLRAGIDIIGEGNDSPGSDFLIRLADEDDPRPIYVTVWGGANTFAQAVWKVQQTRNEEALKRFLHKFRLYTITDQDMQWSMRMQRDYSSHQWLRREFAEDLMFVWDESAWLNQNELGKQNWDKYAAMIQGKGEMGKVYPKFLWGVEGDTSSFLNCMPNGLNNPDDPTQVGWGGVHEFALSPDSITYAWTNWHEPIKSISNDYEHRFYPDEFNDFAARMQWADEGKGNKNPEVYINGKKGVAPIYINNVKADEDLILDASKSFDPDGDHLTFLWWMQGENGMEILGTKPILTLTSFQYPTSIVCEVRDDGPFHLVSYRRIVISDSTK